MTNGSKLGPEVDGRSSWARRLRDVIALYSNDLGGTEGLTESQKSIIRRAATLTVELEKLEASFCLKDRTTPASLDHYQRIASSLRRLLEGVGLSSRRDSGGDLKSDQSFTGVRIARNTSEEALIAPAASGKPDYELARRLAYIIDRALREGSELPEPIAQFAEKLDSRIRISASNGGRQGR